jgi:hypothetical protein
MSKKYAPFRDRYAFERVVGEHNAPTQPCHCCAMTKYDRYTTEFIVIERRFDSPEMLHDRVQKAVCTKCLHYLYGQNMEIYKTSKRKQQYNKNFKALLDWCVLNSELVAVLPTLARFQQLTAAGEQFKPELVGHVARLITSLKTHATYTNYLKCYIQRNEPGASRVLLLKIDQLDLKPADVAAMKKYIGQ